MTAVYNSVRTVASCIQSVAQQDYQAVEYIVVDGLSNDGSAEIIDQHADKIDILIRENDDGMYDALNKGIKAATGEIVGFLHADDLLATPQILTCVANAFAAGSLDGVYGDLVYVDYDDTDRIVRYWRSGNFKRSLFRLGWMPPHPTVYLRKEIYERFGCFRVDMGSGADYELLVRMMYKHNIRVGYIPKILVKMRLGGKSNSSLQNRLAANRSDYHAWIENQITPPFALRFTKPMRKLPQYFRRPKKFI